jgi:hypothetical protein
MTKTEAIRQLTNKERQAKFWRTFKTLRQGRTTQRGLTHIFIPNKQATVETYKTIFEKEKIDNCLLHRNVDHFLQADGSPFTTAPLLDIIGEDGCSPAALQILEGKVPDGLPKITTLLLKQLQKVREPIPLTFTIQDMCNGFSKWRECTTTSPSNKHLGIYKALITADKYLSSSNDSNEPPSSKNLSQTNAFKFNTFSCT